MLVDNVYYITHRYNSSDFRVLLEHQLSKPKGSPLSSAIIEQCISAYIECKKLSECKADVEAMEKLMESLKIQYADFRCYDNSKTVIGNPSDAVSVFNNLVRDYLSEKSKSS